MTKTIDQNKTNQKYTIQVSDSNFTINVSTKTETQHISIHTIQLSSDTPQKPNLLTIKWQIPAQNIKGVWKPSAGFSKRIEADWELDNHIESRISIDAPVISLFSHDDNNVHTFACSEAIDKLRLNSRIREEDNRFYCYTNKTLITQGNYMPYKPLANYPTQKVSNSNKVLYGLHDDFVLSIDDNDKFIDILNAKLTIEVVLKSKTNLIFVRLFLWKNQIYQVLRMEDKIQQH